MVTMRISKKQWFYGQNNSCSCTSHFLVHFFEFHCTFMMWNFLVSLCNLDTVLKNTLKADLDSAIFDYDYRRWLCLWHDFKPSTHARLSRRTAWNNASNVTKVADIRFVSAMAVSCFLSELVFWQLNKRSSPLHSDVRCSFSSSVQDILLAEVDLWQETVTFSESAIFVHADRVISSSNMKS